MRKSIIQNAKLIVTVESVDKKKINTISVFDNRTQKYWMEDQIKERGITYFLNIDDMKETLNWNLNGNELKYDFKWGQTVKGKSTGIAYICD